MKKLSFLLAVLLVITCIPMAAMTTISAATSTAPDGYVLTDADKAAVDAETPFKVGSQYFSTYDVAYEYAKIAGNPNKIEFLDNLEISGDQWYGNSHSSFPEQDLYIDGHGFVVDDNYGSGAYGWKIDNQQTYTVYVEDVIIKTIGFWQLWGNIECTNVEVYSEINKTANTGVVLLQKETHVTFIDCYLKANSSVGVLEKEDGTKYRANSQNPVFSLNEVNDIIVDIKGNTKIEAANSVMLVRKDKGTVMSNVVFNIYDNADIRTVSTDYQGTILFSCEWNNIGINVYGGTLSTIDSAQVVNIGSDANCTGSYLNVYGGILEDDIWYNPSICDLGIYGGKFIVHGKTFDTNGFAQTEGASIRRTVGSTGLRFQSHIPAEVYKSIAANAVEDSIQIGTIIAPYDYLKFAKNNHLTKDCLDGIAYLDIPVTNFADKYDDKTGITLNAAITNILDKNLDRDFVATGYISWEVVTDATTGATTRYTVYSNPQPTQDSARNVSEVAWAALEDVISDPTVGNTDNKYVYSTTTYVWEGVLNKNVNVAPKYSKYSQETMDAIAALVKQ